jgi:hypothetical protein
MLRFTLLVQNIARPPLLFLLLIVQSTQKWLERLLPKELDLSKKSAFWNLVSVRNTISGLWVRMSFLRALTAEIFPSPLQFQERIFIGPG